MADDVGQRFLKDAKESGVEIFIEDGPVKGMGEAAMMAMKQLSQIVHRQAAVMGYGDAFYMLTIFYLGLSLLVLLLNKPSPAMLGGDDAGH